MTKARRDDITVARLLKRNRQIAAIWGIEDVQEVRRDLTNDQAWEVLQECAWLQNSETGMTWFLIEGIANDLFPIIGADGKGSRS